MGDRGDRVELENHQSTRVHRETFGTTILSPARDLIGLCAVVQGSIKNSLGLLSLTSFSSKCRIHREDKTGDNIGFQLDLSLFRPSGCKAIKIHIYFPVLTWSGRSKPASPTACLKNPSKLKGN